MLRSGKSSMQYLYDIIWKDLRQSTGGALADHLPSGPSGPTERRWCKSPLSAVPLEQYCLGVLLDAFLATASARGRDVGAHAPVLRRSPDAPIKTATTTISA